MGEYYDADDFDNYNEGITDDEQEEALSAYEAMIAEQFDSQYARQAWETMQEMQEGDGFLYLT